MSNTQHRFKLIKHNHLEHVTTPIPKQPRSVWPKTLMRDHQCQGSNYLIVGAAAPAACGTRRAGGDQHQVVEGDGAAAGDAVMPTSRGSITP